LKESSRKMPRSLESDSALSRSFMFSALAESFANAGKLDQANSLIERAAVTVRDNGEKYVASEILRVRGSMRLKQAGSQTRSETETALREAIQFFREAMETARSTGAKVLELRAAVDCSEALLRLGCADEARQNLKSAYGWFQEGLDSPDLTAAQRLCQRRIKSTSVRRSKNASVRGASRPPRGGLLVSLGQASVVSAG